MNNQNAKASTAISRRKFLASAAAASALTIVPKNVLGMNYGSVAPSDKITLAHIGCGYQGHNELGSLLACPDIQIVSVCDPEKDGRNYVNWGRGGDEVPTGTADTVRRLLGNPDWRKGINYVPGGRDVMKEVVEGYYSNNRDKSEFKGVSAYADFRELLDKEDVDAIKIMTPDHLHGAIAVAAMKKGVHTVCHKPLANRMNEVKKVMETAKQSNVATYFMAYHRYAPMDLVKTWIDDGAIGTLQEVHNWTNRPSWPHYPELPSTTPPVPEGFDWDLWLGPEKDRPYSPDYTHTVFRGWFDFGGGAMADMGYYSLWTVFESLDLDAPLSAEAYSSHSCAVKNFGAFTIDNDYSFPYANTIRFRYAAKGRRPEIDLFWYDGGMKPPNPPELEMEGEVLPSEGTLFVGDKGKILSGYTPSSTNSRIIPKSKMDSYSGPKTAAPDQIIPTDVAGWQRNNTLPLHMDQWVAACKGGPKNNPGNFIASSALSETQNLGTVAIRAGAKVLYDSQKMEITNIPEANKYLTREYRKGWEL